MANFKEKFKGAYNEHRNETSGAKSTASADPYYYKLARVALRAGIVSAILVFFLAWYVCGVAIIWSLLLALASFILVQPVVGIIMALALEKSK